MIGRRVEDVLQHRDEHHGEQPSEQRGQCGRGSQYECRLAPEERGRLPQRSTEGSHRGELVSPLGQADRDEERHCSCRKQEGEYLLDPADPAKVDRRDRASRLRVLADDVLDRCTRRRGRGGDASRERGRVPGRLDEDDVRSRVVRHRLEIREVRDHERVAWRRRELLNDADDMERNDPEATGALVEHAESEQIVQLERVVGDGLLGDDHAVLRRAKPREHLRSGAAREVRVAQARSVGERRRVDAEDVLEVRADVGVRVIDAGHPGNAGHPGDPRGQAALRDGSGRSADCDVRAERQLRVDPSLLVVRGREDPELDAEREQEPNDHKTTVDRSAASPCTRQEESWPRRRTASHDTPREPREGAPPQSDEEERRPEPQERRG